MGRINVLSFDLANLIAAGEVVERPSSVLKELIENSIDAGSTKIVAEIKRGGVALIRVSDNGSGIDKEDLPIALQRHATSKISSREDLDGILTLGFRGEALAAISSVSNMTIITKTKDSPIGHMLTAEAGRVSDLSEVGCADGTTVVVEDLFYNVPARRKFLKKDATEAMNVAALVERVALSHPEISIQLLVDGEERFCTAGDKDLKKAIHAILGREFASKLIEVDAKTETARVHGFIGRSDNVRKNRNLQNVFINGRYVKSLTVNAAIEKAYTSYIAPEAFPTCVLFVDMNPKIVDVNVHPAKLEVKFSDERAVFEAVYYTVKRALEEHQYRPEMSLDTKSKTTFKNPLGAFVAVDDKVETQQLRMPNVSHPITNNTNKSNHNFEQNRNAQVSYREEKKPLSVDTDRYSLLGSQSKRQASSVASIPTSHSQESSLSPKQSLEILKTLSETAPLQNPKSEPQKAPMSVDVTEIPTYRYVGEAFDCYVLIEYEGDLLVIDKHAAHERVIFEDLKRTRAMDGRVASQALLIPLSPMLTSEELSAAQEYYDELSGVGFSYAIDGGVALSSIPDCITPSVAEELFVTMLDDIVSGKGDPAVNESIRREKALYQIACKAAIKGGRSYDRAVIDWLIGKVLTIPDITVCPHGRPIAYRMTKRELDRQFDRIK